MDASVAVDEGRVTRLAGRWPWAVAGLAVIFLFSFTVGRFPIAPSTALAIIVSKIVPMNVSWPSEVQTIVLDVRLPRILAAMLVGSALTVAGAAYQGVCRNPMVSPDTLGVTHGAGLGAAIAILIGWSGPALQLLAFTCGLVAVTLSYAIGLWGGRRNDGVLVLVLAGITVGLVFASGLSLVKYVADPNNTLPAITFWLMGSLAAVNPGDLSAAVAPIGLGAVILAPFAWRLDILSFGDEEARALGVNVTQVRLAVTIAATLMSAGAVAIAGVVGMIGLIVPHFARMLVGPNHSVLLPTTAIIGAGFLLAVDDLARVAIAGEIPLGILTSMIGAPFFLSLLLKRRTGWAP